MPRSALLIIVLIGLFSGCSNLAPAEPPTRIVAGAHAFGTTALAYTPDGQGLLSGGFKGEIRAWDAATLRPLGELDAHRAPVRALLPLTDGALVSGDDDGQLFLWRGSRVQAQAGTAAVTALALFQGIVISGHADGTLRAWSAEDLKPLRTREFDRPVVALSAHGDRLAVGLDHAVLLLDPDFSSRQTLSVPGTPRDLQFSPDGRTLAAGGWFRLTVWNLVDGTVHSFPTEHGGLLTSISFSPDGRTLATLGRHTDSAIRIVDTTEFRVLRRYQAHELCGAVIRFSPDGRTLASASDDESVRLYYRPAPRPQSSSGAIPSAH